jgi:alpha-N-arabinofuranosidase
MTPVVFLLAAMAAGADPVAGLLRNGSFDEPAGPGGIPGWSQLGDAHGAARLVRDPVSSPPQAVELTVSAKGSSGNQSFMLHQSLPPEPLRGKRVRFGVRVRTEGAGVNVTLFTPEGLANDLFSDPRSGGFQLRSAVLDVPRGASSVSFAIQVLGSPGSRVVVDDAFVQLEGSDPPAIRPAVPATAAATAPVVGEPVRIEIDARRVERDVDPRLFCMHLEWVENGLGLLDPRRPALRKEVLDRLVPLRVPMFRFPGGILADHYDWRLGTGPAESRGSSENPFTRKAERHRFGTPELAELLRATGAKAMITANFGTGSPGMAGDWAAHLVQAGVPAPLWEVGNEIYLSGPASDGPNGRRIYRPGEQYAREFPAFRDAIRKASPGTRVGAIALLDDGAFPMAPAENRQWTERMLGALRTPADFVAVHDAYAPVVIDDSGDFTSEARRGEAYRSLYAGAEQTRENLEAVGALVDRLSPGNRGVPLAVTEFGALFGVSAKPGPQLVYVDQSRTLAAAIYVASLLDVFLGNPRVMAACYTNPIHRWYGSLLTDTDQGLVLTPTYHLYALYRDRFESKLLPVRVSGPRFAAGRLGLVKKRAEVPAVVARASRSADGRRLTVMVVNRSVDRAHDATLTLAGHAGGKADCMVLTAPSPAAVNGPRLTDTTVAGEVVPRPVACTVRDGVAVRLPPSSVVSVVVESR